jgi:hypothetical protein
MPVISLPPEEREISLGIHEYVSLDTILTSIQNPCLFGTNIYGYLSDPLIYPIPFNPPDGLGWDRFEPRDRLIFKELRYFWTGDTGEGIPPFANSYGDFAFWAYQDPEPDLSPAPLLSSPWSPFTVLDPFDNSGGVLLNTPYRPYLRTSTRLYCLTAEYFRANPIPTATLNLNKPNYKSLVSGYSLDNRTIPNFPQIISPIDKTIEISYYRWNRLEGVPNLKSICWMVYKCQLIKDIPYIVPIEDCVLGTLSCSDATALALITGLPNVAGKYKWSNLIFAAIPSLFADWYALYDATNTNPDDLPIFPEVRLLRKIAANNNIWNNATLGSDINPDSSHPMFIVDEDRAYENYLLPQVDGSIGNLIMDSPRTIEIHAALDAGRFATNPATQSARIANLGHLIERIASLLGYRPEPDGTFKKENELTKMRTIVSGGQPLDPTKVGVNNFAEQGMIVRRLNNRFDKDGVKADECVVIHDLIQLMAEYQDQLNLSLNLQESSAIEIKGKNGVARYDNQLALMTELLNLATANQDMIRAALVSSLVAQGQTSELIAAMGLPSVTKSLPVQIGNKLEQLPYTGVAPHRSISQEIATCTQNVGIVLGQLI